MNKLLTITFIIFSIISCTDKESVSLLTIDDAPSYYKLADSSAMSLVKRLGGRLTDAIQNEGVIEAIDVCHKDAYKITDGLVDEIDAITSIKRVSNKYRNPNNAPDKYEEIALSWIEDQLTKGEQPKYYGQKIVKGKKELIRVYKPMKVQNKCLLCHGDDEARLPDVANRINKLYPEDKAIDYQDGDFRGLIRVEMDSKVL